MLHENFILLSVTTLKKITYSVAKNENSALLKDALRSLPEYIICVVLHDKIYVKNVDKSCVCELQAP